MRRWLLWTLALVSSGTLDAQDALLENGRLVDPRSGAVSEAHLLIRGGVIEAHLAERPANFDGVVVDASGGWIVPGLRDMHVHTAVSQAPGAMEMVGTPKAAERMLGVGVVGFLDLFHSEDLVFGQRRQQRQEGQASGADIFAAGPCLTATDGHCTEYPTPTRVIDTPAQARTQIAELAAKKPDVIKLVYAHPSPGATKPARPTLDRETFRAAIAAAREHGVPSVVHIRSWMDVQHAAEDGATAVTHLPGLPAPEGIEKLLARQGTVVIPTLAVGDTVLVTEKARLDSPLLERAAGDRILDAYRSFDTSADRWQGMMNGLAEAQSHRLDTLRLLAEAGVKIVAGTDAGNWFTVHGASVYRELELYEKAGLSPLQVLQTATTHAGDLLGESWGLAPGDPGSVLVLDASPLETSWRAPHIRTVVHHGKVAWERPSMLSEATTASPPPQGGAGATSSVSRRPSSAEGRD